MRRYNIYWDAKDKAHNILPSAIKSKLPKFDAPIPEKSLIETPESLAEAIDDEISMYVEGYDLSEYEYAAWPDEIDVRESSLGVEEGEKVDRIEELCNALEINFGEFVKKNLCEISYDYDDTYTVVNFPLGEINGNISEDFLDKFSSFNSDEQLTVKKHMVNVVDNWETGDFTVLTDAAIYIQLQPDRFDDAIKELESNIKIENEKDASKIDKMAAKGKIIEKSLRHQTLAFLGELDFFSHKTVLENIPKPSFLVAKAGIFSRCLFFPERDPRVVAWEIDWLENRQEIIFYQKKLFGYLLDQNLLVFRIDT